MNSNEMTKKVYTKRMTAWVWWDLQKQPHINPIDVDIEYVDGEKLMVATFTIDESKRRSSTLTSR